MCDVVHCSSKNSHSSKSSLPGCLLPGTNLDHCWETKVKWRAHPRLGMGASYRVEINPLACRALLLACHWSRLVAPHSVLSVTHSQNVADITRELNNPSYPSATHTQARRLPGKLVCCVAVVELCGIWIILVSFCDKNTLAKSSVGMRRACSAYTYRQKSLLQGVAMEECCFLAHSLAFLWLVLSWPRTSA